MQVAAAIVASPGKPITALGLPLAAVKAAYRMLSNNRVKPYQIQIHHRRRTLAACNDHDVVLVLNDTSEINLTTKTKMRGRGMLGNGKQRGLLQHSALAVVPPGDDQPLKAPVQILGLLDQQWNQRTEAPKDETLRQQQRRRTDADVWRESAEAVHELGETSARLIDVCDRHADIFRFMCYEYSINRGFVIRARYDRTLTAAEASEDEASGNNENDTDDAETLESAGVSPHLFETLQSQPAAGETTLEVQEQRTRQGKVRSGKRQARVSVRYAPATLTPPSNDIRTRGAEPIAVHAVMVEECDPPVKDRPLRWILLTSEPVKNAADAWRIVRYYRCRWAVEEFHRALKEGCRLEAGQFDDAEDIQRLAAILSPVAVHLLQLREMDTPEENTPEKLQQVASPLWIKMVAALAKKAPEQLTPREFIRTIAKAGGYLGRKNDPRPGWKVLWRGWAQVQTMVDGVETYQERYG